MPEIVTFTLLCGGPFMFWHLPEFFFWDVITWKQFDLLESCFMIGLAYLQQSRTNYSPLLSKIFLSTLHNGQELWFLSIWLGEHVIFPALGDCWTLFSDLFRLLFPCSLVFLHMNLSISIPLNIRGESSKDLCTALPLCYSVLWTLAHLVTPTLSFISFTQIFFPCTTAWKLSQGSKLGQS